MLADEDGARSAMTASWLAQMGWEVAVLVVGVAGGPREQGPWQPRRPPLPKVHGIEPAELQRQLAERRVGVIDLTTSPEYARGHVPGAWFTVRSQLQAAVPALVPAQPLVLTSVDGALASYAAAELTALTGTAPRVLTGGTRAWIAEGLTVETGPTRILAVGDDVYKRPYEGTDNAEAAMQAYLDWEFGLVAQLERDATHHFTVV